MADVLIHKIGTPSRKILEKILDGVKVKINEGDGCYDFSVSNLSRYRAKKIADLINKSRQSYYCARVSY